MATITFGSNISSLGVQRRLAQNDAKLRQTFERLSSGLSINRASDDASGLAISSGLNVDARVFNQGVRNINDGLSLLNIADGALSELENITFRLNELTVQAANGTLSRSQRQALNTEATALVNEFNRITDTTSFNGRNLLNGAFGALAIQTGYGTNGQISFGLSDELARNIWDETQQAAADYNLVASIDNMNVGDFTGDGKIDIIGFDRTNSRLMVLHGNGDGTFRTGTTQSGVTISTNQLSQVGDFNNDSRLDVVAYSKSSGRIDLYLGNGDGSFQASRSFTANAAGNDDVDIADLNGDNIADLVIAEGTPGSGTLLVYLGNGDGTFRASASSTNEDAVKVGDFNSDGIPDLISFVTNGTLGIRYGNGDGTFQARSDIANSIAPSATLSGAFSATLQVADFNNDGIDDVTYTGTASSQIRLGNGDGTFLASFSIAGGVAGMRTPTDMNGDGYLDFVREIGQIGIYFGNGDGTFADGIAMGVPGDTNNFLADFNGDGVLDSASSAGATNSVSIRLSNVITTTDIQRLNISSQKAARATIPLIDEILSRVIAERGTIGAYQARFTTALSNLQQTSENVRTAAGRITDADIAEDSAKLVRGQILQQAGAAVLAQANLAPELALGLLEARPGP